jgi:branched-chain amino acid transport system permease protein
LLCVVIIWVFAGNFVRSGWGHRLRALRDARRAAESVGIDLVKSQFAVYALSSVPAALAGVVLAYTERFVNAESFGLSLSLLLLTGVVLGGAGTMWGPVVGMAPLLALSFWIGPFSQFNAIALGGGLLVGSLVFTDGLLPALARGMPRTTTRPAPGQAPQRESRVIGATHVVPTDRVVNPHCARNAATAEAIVDARNIVKRFGGLVALDGVNLTLRPGTLVGLVGPNGSGKSTFLNIVSGFIRSDGGRVRIGGVDTAAMKVSEIARCGVGRTFQVPQLVDEYTALENIVIGLVGREPPALAQSVFSLGAVARLERDRFERAFATFVDVGLPERAIHVPAVELPLGIKRVVEVARAVVSSPRLLLLDEPAAGLDDAERAHLGNLLRRLSNGGMTILLVEHNVPFVMAFCDELVLLENGTVTCRATVASPLPERLVAYLSYAPGLTHAAAGTV